MRLGSPTKLHHHEANPSGEHLSFPAPLFTNMGGMHGFQRRSVPAARISRSFASAILVVTALVGLSSCAQLPEPEENIESLTSVTEDPAPPAAAEEYDITLHPDPIVEPLECTQYLVLTARGTGEPKRGQLLSPVARSIKNALPDEVQTINLDYPADTNVNEGGTFGVRLLLDTLRVQAEACPDQGFVLLGYSQGALIIGDALAAPATRLIGETVGEMSEDIASRILAIVLYGNPRFTGGEEYGVGDYDEALGGILPRVPGSLDSFTDRLRDYCVAKDFICQNSLSLDEEGHVAYFENGMQQDGAEFVVDQLRRFQALRTPGPSITSDSPAVQAPSAP